MKTLGITLVLLSTLAACAQSPENKAEMNQQESQESAHTYEIQKSEEEWKRELSDFEYHVLREKGTERPFTGDLLENKKEGVYICRGCGQELFTSESKFNSGTGWPSFFEAIPDKVEEDSDVSYGMVRTEILCDRCGGHLGHVFNDGPQPTGLRYCVNSASLDFQESED